ncbi:MAG: hypothetical protein ACOYOV_17370 [Bacteroidales bacterium]
MKNEIHLKNALRHKRSSMLAFFMLGITIFSFLIFYACKKEKPVPDLPSTTNQGHNGSLKTSPLSAISVVNGVMHISDFYALNDVLEYLDSISDSERYTFENSISFTSLTTVYDSLYLIVENDSTLSQMQSFTTGYPEYFTLTSNELLMNFPYDYYHTIANYHGIFVVGTTSCRITQFGIIAWDGGSISQISQLAINSSFNINNYQYLYFLVSPNYSPLGCSNWKEITTYNNDNDRLVIFSIHTNKSIPNNYGNCQGSPKSFEHYELHVNVYGKKKVKPWGGWRRYYTVLEIKEVYCELDVPHENYFDLTQCKSNWNWQKGGVSNKSKYLGYETRDLSMHWIGGRLDDIPYIGNELCNISNLPLPYFLKVKGKATSRGMQSKWAEINCGY